MRRAFWNPMLPGGYWELFIVIWVMIMAAEILALAVAALGHVPPYPINPNTVWGA